MNFKITTESSCDMDTGTAEKLGIKMAVMEYCVNGECFFQGTGYTIKEFYNKMREGAVTHTSQITEESFRHFFEEVGADGMDILHISFASVCSSTFSNASIAAAEYNRTHNNKIFVFDSKAESCGQGIMVLMAYDYAKTHTLKETLVYLDIMRAKTNMLFTVDNLKYLVAGGRVTKTLAFVAGILRIKPLLYVNERGELKQQSTVISRKASLCALIKKLSLMYDQSYGKIIIGHSDCEEDALFVKEKLSSLVNAEIYTWEIGQVIGSHSGPGTLALFFTSTERYFPK